MTKVDKKIVIAILGIFLLASILGLILNNQSDCGVYAIVCYILFFDYKDITKYDYIFITSAVLVIILRFTYALYKNIYILDLFSIIMWGVAIFVYLKKSKIKNEKN